MRRLTWPTAAYTTDEAVIAFNDPRFVTLDERAFASLAFDHAFADGASLRTRFYYDQYRFDGQYPYEYVDPEIPVTLNRDEVQSQSAGGEVQASRRFGGRHRVTAGAEVRRDFELDQKNFDVEPAAIYVDSRESGGFFGLYAQDEIRLAKQLILNAGIRYDEFSTFGGTLNPRLALIFEASPATTLKVLYGQAFRAPNAYENFYASGINKRNPDLGPETIQASELVVEQRLGRNWRASASLFHNGIRDLIGYREDPADGLFFFDNLDRIVARGIEIEAEAHWDSGLQGRASYSHTDARNTGGDTDHHLSNSPEHLGPGGGDLREPSRRWRWRRAPAAGRPTSP